TMFAAMLFCASGAGSAQTATPIYDFCSQRKCADGDLPAGPLVRDPAGNTYGVTAEGGHITGDYCPNNGCGTIFEIPAAAPKKHKAISVLYRFCAVDLCPDGAVPRGGLIVDVSGNLYGMTQVYGQSIGGTAFMLSPGGTLNVLYSFCQKRRCKDGYGSFTSSTALTYAGATTGALYDGVSPLYGVTGAGKNDCGAVFKLTPHGKKWSETSVHDFCSEPMGADGSGPGGVVADPAGDLYGVTTEGGSHEEGEVFKIHGTSLTVLYGFCALSNCTDGSQPFGAPALDAQGNLFGVAQQGGAGGGGVLYEISSGGTYTKLYDFCSQANCADGSDPIASPYIDPEGNLIGVASTGGAAGGGTLYKMSGAYQVLYNFCSQANCADGKIPNAPVIPDGAGNLLGVTAQGGAGRFGQGGTIFEFTP
ncbi:MAG TPA: choice-of-anchor tandem repeat GloVer-containing protein, partial [Rhizomicrobium sp.]|nr:choice-of-anchor tandem repeat GloVer-containing protein [Rhizomicrobium sp.]